MGFAIVIRENLGKGKRMSESVIGDVRMKEINWNDVKKGSKAKECRQLLATERTKRWILSQKLKNLPCFVFTQ